MSSSEELIKVEFIKEDKLLEKILEKKYQFLCLIIIAGFLLRVKGINYGLPYCLNPDEATYLTRVLYLIKSLFDPKCIEVPNFFLSLNALVLSAASGFSDSTSLIEKISINSSTAIIPLRFVSVFFSLGSILLIYFLGEIFNPVVGLISAVFMSVSLLDVRAAHLFLPFSGMTFFSLLTMFLLLLALTKKNNLMFTYSSISAALSASMHYVGFINIIPIVFALVLRKEFVQIKKITTTIFLIFILLNLHLIFDIPNLFSLIFKRYILGLQLYHFGSFNLFFFQFLPNGLGPIVWLTALVFCFYSKHYDQVLLKVIFSLPVSYLGIIMLFHLTKTGYGELLVPFFSLASGLYLYQLLRNPDSKFLFIVLLLFGIWIPLKYTNRYNKLISLSDTRIIATEWIKENGTEYSKLSWDKNSIKPEWHDSFDTVYLKDITNSSEILNLQKFKTGEKLLRKKNWFKILRKKVDFAITNSLDEQIIIRTKSNDLTLKYYKKLSTLNPIISFNPYLLEASRDVSKYTVEELYSPFLTIWQRERAGPIINVYKL